MSTVAASDAQQFTFQTEIRQLLHLLSHSLYQHKEIAIRELVSNASDALNKLRFARLSGETGGDEELAIVLEPFKEERILEIRDNGIGMSREELIENLGTIAHSGSLAYLGKLSAEQKSNVSLIGQFGVGFYSAFMLADRVEVISRSDSDGKTWRWESDGTGSYSVTAADDGTRGTRIRLHLKDDSEKTFDDYLLPWKLKSIVRQYSTFVPFPIRVDGEQVNTQRPIWVEPKSQIKSEDYTEFYRFLSHHQDDPRWHLHLSSDTPLQLHAVLFCPRENFEKLGFGRIEHGMHLCAKRILVQDDNQKLVPEYLRFLYGLVDSADLPLNVSRETLQDSQLIPRIAKVLTKKVLDHLADLAESDRSGYEAFYGEFGSILRTGVASDWDNRERIAKLLRFTSTSSDGKPLSLEEYKSRMVEGQTQVYFLSGPDLATIGQNPHLELYRKRQIEVLLLTDPVDEWVVGQLGSYGDLSIVSIDSADAQPPERPGSEDEKPAAAVGEKDLETLLGIVRTALGEKVAEVRASTRLTDSPCCLVNPKGAMSPQLQMLLRSTRSDFEVSKRIFEINPKSSFIARLARLAGTEDQAAFVKDCVLQLYSGALLQEGLAPEVHDTAARMQRFMEELAEKRGG